MSDRLDEQIAAALNTEMLAEHQGTAALPSCFAVSQLASRAMGALGSAIAGLCVDLNLVAAPPRVQVDQRLASLWFAQSLHPVDWQLPPVWDAIAGDYRTNDGWIKLHTNLPQHRAAALAVLQTPHNKAAVAQAVRGWSAQALESAIVAAGGVAAEMRSTQAWQAHPQGLAVAAEPLVHWRTSGSGSGRTVEWPATVQRPLQGLRVLDLTRVLAGPVATRSLAGFGAQVLRIDPPGWDEANVVPDITLGKRCSFLDLRSAADRDQFEGLLASADLLVHGYRPDALERLGYGTAMRQRLAPQLLEVALDAYGWTGPWAGRRGFDSLVQMSCGIAAAGMAWAHNDHPTPLPVQALDHATGYLMAAAAVQGLRSAVTRQTVTSARLSLARTAHLLLACPQEQAGTHSDTLDKQPQASDFAKEPEQTPWGTARRLQPALSVSGAAMQWDRPASNLGSAAASW